MLQIGENYKLGSDKYNIILFCRAEIDKEKSERMKVMMNKKWGNVQVENEDEEEDNAEKGWKTKYFFANVKNALEKIITLEVEKSELKEVQTVVDVVQKAEGNICEALSKIPQESIDRVLAEE